MRMSLLGVGLLTLLSSCTATPTGVFDGDRPLLGSWNKPDYGLMAVGQQIANGGQKPVYSPQPLSVPQRTTCQYNPVYKATMCDTTGGPAGVPMRRTTCQYNPVYKATECVTN